MRYLRKKLGNSQQVAVMPRMRALWGICRTPRSLWPAPISVPEKQSDEQFDGIFGCAPEVTAHATRPRQSSGRTHRLQRWVRAADCHRAENDREHEAQRPGRVCAALGDTRPAQYALRTRTNLPAEHFAAYVYGCLMEAHDLASNPPSGHPCSIGCADGCRAIFERGTRGCHTAGDSSIDQKRP